MTAFNCAFLLLLWCGIGEAALRINRTGRSTRRLDSEWCTDGTGGSPWCGSGDAFTDMSCSPYKYQPFTFNFGTPNACNGEPFDSLTGGGDGAWAWAHFDENGQWDTDDYFVFHGCDGAGLQPDCLGDVKYVEHFQGRSNSADCEEDAYTTSNMRNYCKFTHPGTETIYDHYEAGWWNNGNANGAAPNGIVDYMVGSAATTGWGPNMGTGTGISDYAVSKSVMDWPNPYMQYDGQDNGYGTMYAISFTTFSWVCTPSDNSDNDNFAYPSQGGGSTGVKCYADNEPGSDGAGNPGWPPYVFIYHMLLYRESDGTPAVKGQKSWISPEGGSTIQGPDAEFTLKACHGDISTSSGDTCPY